jgi:hypothetical protein
MKGILFNLGLKSVIVATGLFSSQLLQQQQTSAVQLPFLSQLLHLLLQPLSALLMWI